MAKAFVAESESFGMGTIMTHRAFGEHAEESLHAIRREATRLESLMSRFVPGSEISAINRSAGISCERLSADTYEVLSHAAEFSSVCQGLFDVTIGPLVDLWSIGRGASSPPEDSKIRRVLSLVGYTDLVLDPNERAAGLRRAGQSIDLGGIGKGYAGDRFVQVFRDHDVTSAFANIGGNVVALGTRPDGTDWRIGIQHPRQEGSLIGLVSVADKAVVTSGDYQRYFIDRHGRRRHHILDPSTGYPADSGLVSATIVADSSVIADALSTAVFVAGMNRGLGFIRRFPRAEAVLVDVELSVHVTEGLKNCFLAAEGRSVNVIR
ncbi:MAG: FAD:protein FMN transferase [Firmicutes bacterium]|nr:FAD:protein FMN transferase [Bacillota bacterium]